MAATWPDRKHGPIDPDSPRPPRMTIDPTDGVRSSMAGGFFEAWFPFTGWRRRITRVILWSAPVLFVASCSNSYYCESPGSDLAATSLVLLLALVMLRVIGWTVLVPPRPRPGESRTETAARRRDLAGRVDDAVFLLLVAAWSCFAASVARGWS